MSKSILSLFGTRRFMPLLATQFLGAFNDNLFKNAFIIAIMFGAGTMDAGIDNKLLVTIAAGVFVLPYVLFSATAGQYADKIEKSKLAKIVKFIELILMIFVGIGFLIESIWLLLTVLFLMGLQSTFFSPIKYSLIPDHLKEDEILGGNALMEACTFLAILSGTIAGGLLAAGENGTIIVSVILIILAASGLFSSLFIPKSGPFDPDMTVNHNIFTETKILMRQAFSSRIIGLCIMGISWFWFVGATFFTQFPAFTREVLLGDEEVITLLLTAFSIGIALGSVLIHKLVDGEVTPKFVPLGILGMTVFTFDLYFASYSLEREVLVGAWEFLSHFTNIRILFDLMMIAICGGIYIVPLNSMLQTYTQPDQRARMIAANNALNAFFMVMASVLISVFLMQDFTIPEIFLLIAIANIPVALYICKLLPDTVIKAVVKFTLKRLYRVEVEGMENFHKAGDRVVIVANHLAYIDPIFVAAFLPENVTYAVNTHTAQKIWVRPFLSLVNFFPVDPTNPMSTKSLIKEVQKDKKLVIYPEGRLTQTGSLMKVYEGPGMIADKAGATLLPIRLEGLQYTPFSKLRGKVNLHWFPKVKISVLPPQTIDLPEEVKGKQRRHITARKLYDLMSEMMFQTSDMDKSLWQSVLAARNLHGGRHIIAEDILRQPLNYNGLVQRSLILGGYLNRKTLPGEYVGLLLPNACSSLVTFMGLQAYGRVPAMLNYSVGEKSLISACETAKLQMVVTSRTFIEKGKLQHLEAAMKEKELAIIYLEDIRDSVGLGDKIQAFIESYTAPEPVSKIKPDDPAVILFTSGSEGTPKGVVLSHRNLQANRYQLASRIDFTPSDIVFNAMPIFHSFGLSAATILPVLSGVKTFFYPSPLHYRIVPELVYDTNATILFGTDTFLSGYAKFANPYDFYSTRYIFAGAEKLRDETRRLYADQYGIRVLEGYGATETSPVLSMNTPMHNKVGSVGRLLPGISYELEPVEGIEEGGRLFVQGANVMLGYLLAEEPGKIKPVAQGRYDTGDIVSIDEAGFISIKGRAKRFAKIGGEMVSLTAVEQFLAKHWPDELHAVIAVPDDKKGEALVLVTESTSLTRAKLSSAAKKEGLGDINVPRRIEQCDEIPLLGTGKVDYQSLKQIYCSDA